MVVPPPNLVLAAHGSSVAAGRREIAELAGLVGERLHRIEVLVGWLDHAQPTLAEACQLGSVVVPLLLAQGHHATRDVPGAALAVGAWVTPSIGGHPALLRVLNARLDALGLPNRTPVVLAAAGSRDPLALAEIQQMATRLSNHRLVPVIAAFATATPSVGQALRELARPAAVLSYLLAPGRLAGEIHAAAHEAGARWVVPPLGADAAVADAIVDRYRQAVARRRCQPRGGFPMDGRRQLAGSTTRALL